MLTGILGDYKYNIYAPSNSGFVSISCETFVR